jgi:rod shape-determining protein MreD
VQLLFGLVVGVLAALLQGTVVAQLTDGPRPDLALLVVLAWAMLRGFAEGTLAGLGAGLTLDLLSAAPFGLHAGLFVAIGAATAFGEENLFRGNLPLSALAAALAALALHGGALLALQASGQQTVGLVRFLQFAVPTMLLDALLMPLVFWLLRRWVRILAGWRQLEL